MQALIQFTVDGLGFAVLPQKEVQHYLADGELVDLLPDWQLPDYQVFAVVADYPTMPVKTRQAIELLESYFTILWGTLHSHFKVALLNSQVHQFCVRADL